MQRFEQFECKTRPPDSSPRDGVPRHSCADAVTTPDSEYPSHALFQTRSTPPSPALLQVGSLSSNNPHSYHPLIFLFPLTSFLFPPSLHCTITQAYACTRTHIIYIYIKQVLFFSSSASQPQMLFLYLTFQPCPVPVKLYRVTLALHFTLFIPHNSFHSFLITPLHTLILTCLFSH